MEGRDIRETERNNRSENFLDTNAADFADIEAAVEMIAELKVRVGNVREEYENQLRFGSDVKYKYDLVRDTFDELLPGVKEIRDIAKSMSRKIPGIEELFSVPSGIGRRALVALTRVFIDNSTQYAAEFKRNGYEAAFFTNLGTLADKLENALDEAAESTGERVGATDSVHLEVQAASDIVEDIDPIVRRVYKKNPAKLAQWNFARKVERHTPQPRGGNGDNGDGDDKDK